MLVELDQLGLLTISQIAELVFCDRPNTKGEARTDTAAQTAAKRTCQRLWENGLVARAKAILTSRRTGEAYIGFVNVLTAAGAAAVEERYAETGAGDLRWTKDSGALRPDKLEHALAINDVHVRARRAARRGGLDFAGWLDDRQLTAMTKRGETHFVVIPDGFFLLRQRGRVHGYFLEVDLRTEPLTRSGDGTQWRAKLDGYDAYFRDHYPSEAFFEQLPAPLVLTVTTSAKRLEHMRKMSRNSGDGRFWYTTRDELDPVHDPAKRVDAFLASIWRTGNDAAPRSLLEVIEREEMR